MLARACSQEEHMYLVIDIRTQGFNSGAIRVPAWVPLSLLLIHDEVFDTCLYAGTLHTQYSVFDKSSR
jgi:hypothetical protein